MKNVINKLQGLGYEAFTYNSDKIEFDVPVSKATHLELRGDGVFESVKIPKRKSLHTVEYFVNKINNNKVYESFAGYFKSLLGQHSVNASVYATTYGIGVYVAFGNDKSVKQVGQILDTLKIDYQTEYSDAQWVLRYKISKARNNIDKITKLINH